MKRAEPQVQIKEESKGCWILCGTETDGKCHVVSC